MSDLVIPGEGEDTDARYVPWMLAGELPGYEAEQRLLRADGEKLLALVSVSLVRDAEERPLYLIVQVPLQVEEVMEHPDGPHTYLSTKFPLRDDAGRSYAVCAIATDITDRK